MPFHDQQLISMTFKAWKMKFLNLLTFHVIHDLGTNPVERQVNSTKKVTYFSFCAQTTNQESDFHGVLQFLDPGF